ncbi:hypothetical protein [Pseudomonas sp. B11(2017)]|uniref:hypothetical protein n=1 Tax=Pseudomonas sp. B11(2017) TaxID=1981748 RepID=UPI000A1FBD07|nr:hypothetical protein [Pseudomonas sp. B11(2017)]
MNESGVQANQSLVLNGAFTEAFTHWRKGSLNPDWLAIEAEAYQEDVIRLLAAGNQSSVSQALSAPKTPSPGARYVLSFLCETRHAEAGWLRVGIQGRPERLEIALLPGASRDIEADRARLAAGQPLEFRPREYREELALPFSGQDTLVVEVQSPANAPGDYLSKICITRIRLEVHLEPATMVSLILDEQPLAPLQTVYLCKGATAGLAHRLGFNVAPDSAWHTTRAALTSDDNPQQAVVAWPVWGEDQPLDLPWILDCPVIGEDGVELFTVNLVNQYTADPYPLTVSLGHHRLVFLGKLEAAHFPVLALKQSVRLGVQVASHYTGQPLGGRTVTWRVAGQTLAAADSDPQGWAWFDYLPTAAGDFTVAASVDSPYYASGAISALFEVRVLATDPWSDALAVVEDAALPWAQSTGYPNRGTDYPLRVRLPAGSPMLGTEVSLHWSGDSHEQLGVGVSPALGQPQPVESTHIDWTLSSEDRLDGQFSLTLACSKLLHPSPAKPMSLARNVVRIGEVREADRFPVVDEGESVLLRVQVIHVVASGDGDPVSNAQVDWVTPEGTVSTRSGAGGWASMLYRPARAGDLVVTARVRAHAEAVAVERPFAVKALATSPWKDRIRILFDERDVDLVGTGLLCRRGGAHVLKILPVAGSPFIGQSVTLDWRAGDPGIGLSVSGLGSGRILTAAGLEWTFSSSAPESLSALFALQLSTGIAASPRELIGRLIAADLADELTVMLDQVTQPPAGQPFYPCLGARHAVRYLPNPLSPLVGLQGRLVWQGTPADDLQAGVEPPPDRAQPIEDGGVAWTLDFTSSPTAGDFSLALALPALGVALQADAMHLGHNRLRIANRRDTAVDPVVGQDRAWLWVQVESVFTGQPVAQAPVDWSAQGEVASRTCDETGWSGFGFAPVLAGEHTVEAQVLSRFDGFQERRPFPVTALADDPWRSVQVRFDGQPASRWGEQTFFPRRKGEHRIEVLAEAGSPLLERSLTLGLTGTGPAELGLQFQAPGLGAPRLFSGIGLHYLLRCGDLKDGGFALRLGAERLASLSPANAMSLGEGAQVMEIEGTGRTRQVLDWGEELVEQVRVIASTTGKPMVGATVAWEHPDLEGVTSQTDFYGVAKVRFRPHTTGTSVLVATVGSVSVELAFTLNEPREISELYEPDGPQPLPDRSGVLARAVVLSAFTGLPLAGVEVWWDFSGHFVSTSLTDAEGIAQLAFTYPEQGVLGATVKGGLGGWDYTHILFDRKVPTITSLTSPDQDVGLGRKALAQVTVASALDGLPIGGVNVEWSFPGVTLPSTFTNPDGRSLIEFVPPALGKYSLQATIDVTKPHSLDFNIVESATLPQIYTIGKLHGQSLIGAQAHCYVLVRNPAGLPVEGEEVFWSFPKARVVSTIADSSGRAEVKFVLHNRGTLVARVRGGSDLALPL